MKFKTKGARLAGLLVPALALAAPAFLQMSSLSKKEYLQCEFRHIPQGMLAKAYSGRRYGGRPAGRATVFMKGEADER